MSAAREPDQADFDLEAFIDLFDEALTSDDPSVQKTLQHLMVIAALARNHAKHDRRNGPLRRLYDDQHEILRRLERLEVNNAGWRTGAPYQPSPMPSPMGPSGPVIWPHSTPGTAIPGTGTGGWPGLGPNQIWCGTNTSGSSYTVPNGGAIGVTSATSVSIAERVEDLLKDPKYKGSSLTITKQKDEL